MRLEDPLVTNRRVTIEDTVLGGRTIPANSRVTINWLSANRDEDAFEDALTYNRTVTNPATWCMATVFTSARVPRWPA